eukprot:tig00021352_g20705.t1
MLLLIGDVLARGDMQLDRMAERRMAELLRGQDEVLTREDFLDGTGWSFVQACLATERGRRAMFTALAGSLEARLPCSELARFVRAFEPGLGPAEAEWLVRQAAGEAAAALGHVGRKEFLRAFAGGLPSLLQRAETARRLGTAERVWLSGLQHVAPIEPEPSPRVKLDVPPSRYMSPRRRLQPASAPSSPSRGFAGPHPPPCPGGLSCPPSPGRILHTTPLVPLFSNARPSPRRPAAAASSLRPATSARGGPPQLRKGPGGPSRRRRTALFALWWRALAVGAPWLADHAEELGRLALAAQLAGVAFSRPPPPPPRSRGAPLPPCGGPWDSLIAGFAVGSPRAGSSEAAAGELEPRGVEPHGRGRRGTGSNSFPPSVAPGRVGAAGAAPAARRSIALSTPRALASPWGEL